MRLVVPLFNGGGHYAPRCPSLQWGGDHYAPRCQPLIKGEETTMRLVVPLT